MILPNMAPMKDSIDGHDTHVGMCRQEGKVKGMILRLTTARLYCRTYRRMLAQVMACTQAKEEGFAMGLQKGATLRLHQHRAGGADVCPVVSHPQQVHI